MGQPIIFGGVLGSSTSHFVKWINQKGIKTLAVRFKVSERTIYRWRMGSDLPTYDRMYRIVKMSKGSVTYADMIHHHLGV